MINDYIIFQSPFKSILGTLYNFFNLEMNNYILTKEMKNYTFLPKSNSQSLPKKIHTS